MAITLMAISLMFVVCQIIKLITDVYEMSVCNYFKIAAEGYDNDCASTETIDVFASLGNLFCCINSAANFLFYIIKGKKFREAFYKKYFSFCKEEQNAQNTLYMRVIAK